MAAGKVCTGFSKPYVAKYSASGTTVTYSDAQLLARGVEVNLEVESGDANNFYADNIVAETEAGQFTGGTLTLTVDGLLQDMEKYLHGLENAGADGFVAYGDNNAPYVAVGFLVRYMSAGVTYYTPVVVAKCLFADSSLSAKTQEDQTDWQTQELKAAVLRDDTTDRAWKYVGTDYTTEAAAEAALQTKLNYTPTPIITT